MFLNVPHNFLKTFSLFVLSFLILTLAASALAINSKTHLSLALNSTAPFTTSASPSIGSTIIPQGVLTNQQSIVSTTTPIINGTVELYYVTASKSITTATTNNDGKYQAVLKIVCNNTFKIEARFAGTSDYLPETSYQVTVTPTGGSPCVSGQDPYQVVSTAPPTATGSSGSSKDYVPLVQIPGIPAGANFLQYLSGMYNFLISIVGILAMVSLVYGGFRYLTSVGNPAAVEDAKDIINSAIIGLVLALSSWLILNEINPDVLVTNRKPGITGQTWPGYNYNQPPSTRDCVADINIEGVFVSGDPTKKKCRCVDDPTRDVTFTPSTPPTGPYVVSTSIVPCAVNVPTSPTTSSITITFNEAIDPASVTQATVSLGINTPASASGNQVIVNTSGLLNYTADYQLTLTTGIKDTKGISMASDYKLRFSTNTGFNVAVGGSCVVPVPAVADCTTACSNPATPGLTPKGYHCLKADLRVGTSPHPIGKEVTISIAKKERVYMDARSNSRDYAYGGLNLSGDPYVSGSGFDNGIDRYEINYSRGIGLIADYAQSEGTICSVIAGTIGAGISTFWNVAGIDDWAQSDGARLTIPYPYTTQGKYEGSLRVQGKSGGSACSGTASDTVTINVIP